MEMYFRSELCAQLAAQRLGMSRESFEHHLAAIFSSALEPDFDGAFIEPAPPISADVR